MGLCRKTIYHIPNQKSYYVLVSDMGNYGLDPYKRYCFRYFNKFGSGITWKDEQFIARLIPANCAIQLLYGD